MADGPNTSTAIQQDAATSTASAPSPASTNSSSSDCAAIGSLLDFLPSTDCCGYYEISLTDKSQNFGFSGYSNITCNAQGRVASWSLNWVVDNTMIGCNLGFCDVLSLDPLTALTELEHWTFIVLYNLRFTFPKNMEKLSKLKTMEVTGPFLGSLPPSLGKLTNLEKIYLQGFNPIFLTGPLDDGRLPSLELPNELGDLINLKYLTFSTMHVTKLPESFEKISLAELHVYDSRMEVP
ncbi:hypothetical protein HDU97_008549 [Phlyctochytrium planicorne]|nr:hypothetical protein HDU97_008549 [Phlyctochytrium planicorne]